MRPEKDSEACTKSEENRKQAGFEFAAEPKDVILFFPTIYYMAGISVIIIILSIVLWATLREWDYFIWSMFSTLSIGFMIFLPEHFSNIIYFAVYLYLWIAFCIFILVYIIIDGIELLDAKALVEEMSPALSRSYKEEEIARLNRLIAIFYGCTVPMLLLTLLVTVLLFRMTLFHYKNR